jgi:hypothetical protein
VPPRVTESAPTEAMLKKIAKMDEYDKEYLASKKGQHPDVLRCLAKDHSLHDTIASNANMPLDVFEIILKSYEEDFAEETETEVAEVEDEFADEDEFVEDIPDNPWLDMLNEFSLGIGIESSNIAWNLIANPATPVTFVNDMALRGIFHHDKFDRLTTETVWLLFTGQQRRRLDIDYVKILVNRPDLSLEVLRFLSPYYYQSSKEDIVRYVAVSLVDPKICFNEIITSHNWVDRFAFSSNPLAAEKDIAKLAHDGNRFVRAAAKARLASPEWRFDSA